MSNQTSIELQKDGRTLTLYVIRSARKSIGLQMREDGTVLLRIPNRLSARALQDFSDTGADVDLAKNRTDAVTYKTAGNNRCNPSGATLKQRSGSD